MKPILTISLLFLFNIMYGQIFSLTVKVSDKYTHKAIRGATVHIVGSDGTDKVFKTDSNGIYLYEGKPTGEHLIKANTTYSITADASDQEYLTSNETKIFTTKDSSTAYLFNLAIQLNKSDYPYLSFPKCLFGFGTSEITQGTKDTALYWLVKLLKDNPFIKIELDGHASPDEKHAPELSQKRADNCAAYLASQGIDSARMIAKGWAAHKPLPGCGVADIQKMKTKAEKVAAYQADRRVEFRILSFKYVPKGGYSHEDSLRMEKLKDAKIHGNY